MNGNPVRAKAAKESFLLLNPDLKKNSHEVAMAIASCRDVKRVIVTSGDFGFVVSTEEKKGYNTEKINRSIRRALGGKKTEVMRGHHIYSAKT